MGGVIFLGKHFFLGKKVFWKYREDLTYFGWDNYRTKKIRLALRREGKGRRSLITLYWLNYVFLLAYLIFIKIYVYRKTHYHTACPDINPGCLSKVLSILCLRLKGNVLTEFNNVLGIGVVSANKRECIHTSAHLNPNQAVIDQTKQRTGVHRNRLPHHSLGFAHWIYLASPRPALWQINIRPCPPSSSSHHRKFYIHFNA